MPAPQNGIQLAIAEPHGDDVRAREEDDAGEREEDPPVDHVCASSG